MAFLIILPFNSGGWAQQRTAPGPGARRALAVDGKAVRGPGSQSDGQAAHLLAALDQQPAAWSSARSAWTARPTRSRMFATLLDRVDLAGA